MSVLGEQAAVLPEVDPQRPSVARIYNFLLGGRHNFAADRQAAAAAQAVMPELPAILRLNRQFLREAVRLADAAGIDQYLDLGCGIPSAGNTYDVVRRLRPAARVIGVDIEPVAFVHGRLQLAHDPAADVLYGDLLDAYEVLGSPPVREMIDLGRPVCLMLVAVAHFIPDTGRLHEALAVYRDALPRGSLLVLTHACRKGASPRVEQVRRIYNNTTAPMAARDAAETLELFGDWPLLEPGLMTFGEWCSAPGRQCESDIAEAAFLVGVARKP
ncbi:SAM-dependent methyltransferase [Actinoplanes sp. LDG1-06]|uniref:SAM-dependent methyltransferase n=1 Tax=Paractinoplanes ovalisporus TaxID=2810368 RepID=A0ABS2ANC7_9ACTN|nr:SAM-dependent methyltransferase [Actinoplanes ovalisporus]MBM2621341.1 SAM-dependent methyltransferase [Actinoplanes ovalisporus]